MCVELSLTFIMHVRVCVCVRLKSVFLDMSVSVCEGICMCVMGYICVGIPSRMCA